MAGNWESDVDMLQCQIQDLSINAANLLARLDAVEAKLYELRDKKMQSLDGVVEAALFGSSTNTYQP